MKAKKLMEDAENQRYFEKFFDYEVIEELGRVSLNGCPGYQYVISNKTNDPKVLTVYKNWVGGGARIAIFVNVK